MATDSASAFAIPREEFRLAASNYKLAYRVRLEEALAASVASSPSSPSSISAVKRSGSLSPDCFHPFVPASAVAAGRGLSLKGKEGFPSMDCFGTFVPGLAMAAGGPFSKEEEGFPSTDLSLTFTPVSTMAAGGFSSKKEDVFLLTSQFHTFVPALAVAAGGLSSKGKEGFKSIDCFGTSVPGSAMAAGGFSSKEEEGLPSMDLSLTFAPMSAMATGGFSSKNEEGFPLTGQFHTFIPASAVAAGGLSSKGKEGFPSTDCFGTFLPGLAMAAGGFSSKEEEGFPSTDLSLTFTPVSTMAAGDFSSKKEESFPLTSRFHTFIPASAMAAGGFSSKGNEGFPSTDFFGTFVPGSAMAAGGFSSRGKVESFPSMDLSLALSLQSPELSWLLQEAADRLTAASEAEQNRAKIHQMTQVAELARHIHEALDHEWEEHGDLFENPLETAPPPPPNLYFSSICHGEDTNAPSSSSSLATSATASFMGMVILDQSGNALMEMKKPLGSPSTKIESDYMALIMSLEGAQSAGFQHVQAYTDSVALYNQVKGKWKVSNNKILTLWSQVMMYIHKFQGFELHLLFKIENQHARKLARDAINSKPFVRSKNASSSHDNIRNVNELVLEDCTICLEERSGSVMVTVTPCSHRFCMSCVVQHMEVKVQAGQVPVQCPHLNCKSSFSLEQCKAALSQKWFDLLMQAMREASIPEQERVYCPFLRCSALMLKKDLKRTFPDTSSSSSLSSLFNSNLYNCVTCVECRLFFCCYCRVPWHSDMSCEEYQNSLLNGQDTPEACLYSLAKDHKWQRCKKCRRMIELAEGCYHVTCRCGHEFCYACGSEWVDKKQACKCQLWDESPIMSDTDSDGFDHSDDEF